MVRRNVGDVVLDPGEEGGIGGAGLRSWRKDRLRRRRHRRRFVGVGGMAVGMRILRLLLGIALGIRRLVIGVVGHGRVVVVDHRALASILRVRFNDSFSLSKKTQSQSCKRAQRGARRTFPLSSTTFPRTGLGFLALPSSFLDALAGRFVAGRAWLAEADWPSINGGGAAASSPDVSGRNCLNSSSRSGAAWKRVVTRA